MSDTQTDGPLIVPGLEPWRAQMAAEEWRVECKLRELRQRVERLRFDTSHATTAALPALPGPDPVHSAEPVSGTAVEAAMEQPSSPSLAVATGGNQTLADTCFIVAMALAAWGALRAAQSAGDLEVIWRSAVPILLSAGVAFVISLIARPETEREVQP